VEVGRRHKVRFAVLIAFSVVALIPLTAAATSLSQQQTQEIASLEQVTSQLRQLPALRSVKVQIQSDSQFNAVIRTQMQAQNPDSEIQTGQRESVLLGLLRGTDSLRHILFSSVTGNIIGLYDPDTETLYVRNHDNLAFGIERHVLVHEYNHALQDQHYGLKRLLPSELALTYRNTDAVGAHHALTEGDSINVETIYVERNYSGQELNALGQYEATAGGPALPKAIKEQLLFAYTYGYSFVSALYRHGGMAAVDAAYARLPSSTYEIMHPSSYLKGWKPVMVAMHAVAGFSAWKQVDDDVFGALGYEILLRQFGSGRRADVVTNAYRGDRYVFLENGTQDAMLFKSVWSDKAAAQAARDALLAGLQSRFRHIHVATGSPTVARDKHVSVAFTVNGAVLTMAYAPTALLARQLVAAPTT
jgi:hypothetical protein